MSTRTSLDDADRGFLEAKNFVHVSTLREDGTIHTVPIWVDADGDEILLNSAEGRAWVKNLERTGGNVTLTVQDLENPYRYLTVTGVARRAEGEDADAHIDSLAQKYMGVDTYPLRQEGEVRVKFRVKPARVSRFGDS